MQRKTHIKFKDKYGGSVFTVYSVKNGNNRKIYNIEVIDKIKKNISDLLETGN